VYTLIYVYSVYILYTFFNTPTRLHNRMSVQQQTHRPTLRHTLQMNESQIKDKKTYKENVR